MDSFRNAKAGTRQRGYISVISLAFVLAILVGTLLYGSRSSPAHSTGNRAHVHAQQFFTQTTSIQSVINACVLTYPQGANGWPQWSEWPVLDDGVSATLPAVPLTGISISSLACPKTPGFALDDAVTRSANNLWSGSEGNFLPMQKEGYEPWRYDVNLGLPGTQYIRLVLRPTDLTGTSETNLSMSALKLLASRFSAGQANFDTDVAGSFVLYLIKG